MKIARLGDEGSHGGVIISASPDTTCDGIQVARNNDTLNCAVHGLVPVTAITTHSTCNGRLILTVGAIASCGATIITGGSAEVE